MRGHVNGVRGRARHQNFRALLGAMRGRVSLLRGRVFLSDTPPGVMRGRAIQQAAARLAQRTLFPQFCPPQLTGFLPNTSHSLDVWH